jgi:vitamin K-dependent gamma-carboxylase
MHVWLVERENFGILDRFFHAPWAAYAASYGSLLLDLFLAPLLLWRRTRLTAFCAAVIFHLLNAWRFELDIFPWFAIAATTLFLSPSWPRRILRLRKSPVRVGPPPERKERVRKQTLVLSLTAIYIAIQVLVPLRNFIHHGGIEWSCMEHRFSWQMMLHRHSVTTYFYVTDPSTREDVQIQPERYLSRKQISRMGWRPDMVRQFAHYLAQRLPQYGSEPLRVEVRMFVSINGRKPTLVFDPNVNLAAEPQTWSRPRWLREVHDPLPPPGQDYSGDPYARSPEGEQ